METTILMEHVDIYNEIVNEHNKLTIQISHMKIKTNNEENRVGMNVPKTCKYDVFDNTIHNFQMNKKENNNNNNNKITTK
jgi:hypothetical protein